MSKSKFRDIGKSQFKTILQMPITWMRKGDNLFHSVNILFKKSLTAKIIFDKIIKPLGTHDLNKKEILIMKNYELYNQSAFLFGLSIENYLKGLWILQNCNNIIDYNQLPYEIKTHDLIELSNKTGIKLINEEKVILTFLIESITWYGRYPIPLNINKNEDFWDKKATSILLFENFQNKPKLTKHLLYIIKKIYEKYNSFSIKLNL